MHRPAPLLFVLPLILLAACTASPGDQPTSDEQPTSSDAGASPPDGRSVAVDGVLIIEEGATASGPGISVEDALDQMGGDQPLLVNGALVIDQDGLVLLCGALAESFPPQCGGARLEVRGLDPAGQPDLEEANGVRWLDSVQLLGRVVPAD